MHCDMKSLRGSEIYKFGSSQPWGTVRSVLISPYSGKVVSILANTISIIPLSFLIDMDNLLYITPHKITLKKNCTGITYIQNDFFIYPESMHCVANTSNIKHKIKDFTFDTESGDISEITVSAGRFSRKKKISINNIEIKDNTIYIK